MPEIHYDIVERNVFWDQLGDMAPELTPPDPMVAPKAFFKMMRGPGELPLIVPSWSWTDPNSEPIVDDSPSNFKGNLSRAVYWTGSGWAHGPFLGTDRIEGEQITPSPDYDGPATMPAGAGFDNAGEILPVDASLMTPAGTPWSQPSGTYITAGRLEGQWASASDGTNVWVATVEVVEEFSSAWVPPDGAPLAHAFCDKTFLFSEGFGIDHYREDVHRPIVTREWVRSAVWLRDGLTNGILAGPLPEDFDDLHFPWYPYHSFTPDTEGGSGGYGHFFYAPNGGQQPTVYADRFCDGRPCVWYVDRRYNWVFTTPTPEGVVNVHVAPPEFLTTWRLVRLASGGWNELFSVVVSYYDPETGTAGVGDPSHIPDVRFTDDGAAVAFFQPVTVAPQPSFDVVADGGKWSGTLSATDFDPTATGVVISSITEISDEPDLVRGERWIGLLTSVGYFKYFPSDGSLEVISDQLHFAAPTAPYAFSVGLPRSTAPERDLSTYWVNASDGASWGVVFGGIRSGFDTGAGVFHYGYCCSGHCVLHDAYMHEFLDPSYYAYPPQITTSFYRVGDDLYLYDWNGFTFKGSICRLCATCPQSIALNPIAFKPDPA